MDAKTYELMTSADVTIDHIFSLFAPGITRYSLHLAIADYPIAKRDINILCDINDNKCVLAFSDEDAQFILAISDKPVIRCWMTEEPYDDDDDIIVNRAHVVIAL